MMRIDEAITERTALITGEELLRMGDIGPSELVHGRIVRMSPTGFEHGAYESNFVAHLRTFVKKHRLGAVVAGEVGIYIRRNPDTIRAADVAFVSNERLAQRQKKRGFLDVAPELIVEVMSPDDRWVDIDEKLRDYFSIGVRLVWVANPSHQVIYAYRSPTEIREYKATDSLSGDDVLPGFDVPVVQLFED